MIITTSIFMQKQQNVNMQIEKIVKIVKKGCKNLT